MVIEVNNSFIFPGGILKKENITNWSGDVERVQQAVKSQLNWAGWSSASINDRMTADTGWGYKILKHLGLLLWTQYELFRV